MNKNRRLGLVVAPALLSAMVLTGCQDEAPTASAPSAPSQSTQSQEQGGDATQSQSSSSPDASSSSSTTESSSSTTESSSSSSDSSGGAGQCDNSSTFKINRGSAEAKPLDTEQEAKGNGGSVKIKFGQPTVNTSGGNSYFPGSGMQTVIYPVTMKASGSYWIAARLKFGLNDASGTSCKSDTLGAVLPTGESVEVKSLREGDTYSGKLAFAVPSGADLSKYTLVFKEDYPGDADIAWLAK